MRAVVVFRTARPGDSGNTTKSSTTHVLRGAVCDVTVGCVLGFHADCGTVPENRQGPALPRRQLC